MPVIIGLGSNLERPLHQLREACRRIANHPAIEILSYSNIYQSASLLPGQPDYLNAAISLKTSLPPVSLLGALKKIESDMGRVPAERWMARCIDLDILIYEYQVLIDGPCQIPHPELHNRPFAISPMLDVSPEQTHPLFPLLDWRKNLTHHPVKKLPHLLTGAQMVGVLNITPDSFSDGGKFLNPDLACQQAAALFENGADVIEIGAESVRPGATLVSEATQWQRLEPVLQTFTALFKNKAHRPLISLDTRCANLVQLALEKSTLLDWVNDVSQAEFEKMIPMLREHKLNYVVMHHLGIPPRPDHTLTTDPGLEFLNFQRTWQERFEKLDLCTSQLILDPGIGFGKTPRQQMTMLKSFAQLRLPGAVYLIGHSRKSFLNEALVSPNAEMKELATAILSAQLSAQGVDYLRVHRPELSLAAMGLSARELKNERT